MDTNMAIKSTIQLPPPFIKLLETALAENITVVAALTGFYQGRNLTGEYNLKLTGAQLVPKTDQNNGRKH